MWEEASRTVAGMPSAKDAAIAKQPMKKYVDALASSLSQHKAQAPDK